jgi:predicted PurR-regulated permease PerM
MLSDANILLNTAPVFFVKSVWALSTILILLIIYYLINIGNNYIPEKKQIRININAVLPILGMFVLIYFMLFMFKRYPIIAHTLFTITLSVLFAYILNPLVVYFESKGMKRIFAVITIYFIIIGILFIFAFLVIPTSSKEIGKLVNNLPLYFSNLTDFVDSLYNRYYSLGDLPPILHGIEKAIIDNISRLEGALGNGIEKFIQGAINSFSKMMSFVLIPILTFYFLIDKDFFKKNIKELIPNKYRNEVIYLANEIDTSVSKFFRGRVVMAVFVGVATSIFLVIMDVDFAVVIGFITMIADIIPYIGPFLGFLPAVIFAFLSNPIKALWVSVFFVLIQWVENNIVGPKILGNSTGMHPLTILISIIIGGAIFGVLGMILSVPLVAISKIFFKYFNEKLNKPPEERF